MAAVLTARRTPLLARSWRDGVDRLRGWGWPFALGVACLLGAAALAWLWLPALRRDAVDQAAAADLAEHHARTLRRQRQDAAPPPSERARFIAGFPASDTRQARIAALFTLAAARQLEPHPSEFKLSEEHELDLLAYNVTMPLTGTYAQLRDFIAAAQANDPALSLDHLRLRRAAPGAPLVEADLAWTFYMRPGTAMRPAAAASSVR